MAIMTQNGHVSRALDFYGRDDLYFGIGRTSAWADEKSPPIPEPTSVFEEAVGFKKIDSKFLVYPDDNGEIDYLTSKWKICLPSEAFEKGARWVYVSTKLAYTELSTDIVFRQIALLSRLIRKSGVPEDLYVLTPEQVQDQGILEVLDNKKPVYRDPTHQESITQIIQF